MELSVPVIKLQSIPGTQSWDIMNSSTRVHDLIIMIRNYLWFGLLHYLFSKSMEIARCNWKSKPINRSSSFSSSLYHFVLWSSFVVLFLESGSKRDGIWNWNHFFSRFIRNRKCRVRTAHLHIILLNRVQWYQSQHLEAFPRLISCFVSF